MKGGTFSKALAWMIAAGAMMLPAAAVAAEEKKADGATPKYLGAEKCKTCHQGEKKGDQFKKWQEVKHAKAFDTLGSPEARNLAKEKGIDDPQKSEKCLKCHVTAFGEPADRLLKGFDPKLGVQCESCHGPGERHFKARMMAAMKETPADKEKYKPVPADEIVAAPALKACLTCHNEESPSFKAFCMKKRAAEIAHLDPRKPRGPEHLAAMKCGCGDKCECKQGDCGGLEEAARAPEGKKGGKE